MLKPRAWSTRTLVTVLAGVVILLTGCGAGTPSTTTSTSTSTSNSTAPSSTSTTAAAGSPNCTTSQITVSAGLSSGAVGTIAQVLVFENSSSSSCVLHGFPGVAGLDNAGNQLVQASREVDNTPFTGSTASLPTVTLLPGQSASATLFGSDVPTGSATSCVTYAALLVTPPNAFQSVKVDAQMPGCAGLRVSPVYAGTNGGTS
jgi:hypothetical protein